MKQFGLFLIRNSASVLAVYFLGWALMEIGALNATGKAFAEIKANAQAFLRKRFG